jgi:hypothetical protein
LNTLQTALRSLENEKIIKLTNQTIGNSERKFIIEIKDIEKLAEKTSSSF